MIGFSNSILSLILKNFNTCVYNMFMKEELLYIGLDYERYWRYKLQQLCDYELNHTSAMFQYWSYMRHLEKQQMLNIKDFLKTLKD